MAHFYGYSSYGNIVNHKNGLNSFFNTFVICNHQYQSVVYIVIQVMVT